MVPCRHGCLLRPLSTHPVPMSSSPSLSRHRKGCFLINSNVDSKSSLSPPRLRSFSLSFWLKYPTPTGAPWSESFLTYWLFPPCFIILSRTSQLMAYGRLGLEVFCKLWVTALFLSSVSGRFIVEKSSVRVLRPAHIRGTHEGAIANFGVPKYGGMLRGVVLYPEKGSTGCISFDEIHFKSRSGRPVILLLDRGDCYFALKAWNAQNAGAAAVLIADNIDEPLITMDTPDESRDEGFVEKIVIPSALINREFGEALKIAVNGSEEVVVRLDWRESMPHPDERVEYEFWTNSNDECGTRCDEQMNFIQNFKGHAQILERGGYTQFTPHYITWYCPEIFLHSKQCLSQCINHGRYCAPDPEQDFSIGYEGKDVVLENLRQLCVHRVSNENYNRSWVLEKKYSKECAEDVIKSLGIPLHEVKECMGDPEADVDNLVLKKEQELQVGHGTRGDVTILPTMVINNVQYRGTLERMAVLKAICAGFKESTEPSLCLNGDIETNECLERNGGHFPRKNLNALQCRAFSIKEMDTFSAKLLGLEGVQWIMVAVGQKLGMGKLIPHEYKLSECRCPFGFNGDGQKCEDTDECKEKLACQCDGCSCKNTWGGYDCKCKGNLVYIKGEDICIDKNVSRFGWLLSLWVLSCVVGAGIAGYIFYKYRLRSYMDSEIMAIMSQYMPLDNHQIEAQPLRQDSML
ncbi:hypothetical protein HPP92_028079 [Vanilla planifolia]|uniref:EGF-like calcium-binding domain-containing protein n=1 Tax=Vanilla planifolia TaxID=51239 RepID=A0A835PAI3_VANPL|nr:hypothetical protein HPP92_028079 [Vanilla planifolia]